MNRIKKGMIGLLIVSLCGCSLSNISSNHMNRNESIFKHATTWINNSNSDEVESLVNRDIIEPLRNELSSYLKDVSFEFSMNTNNSFNLKITTSEFEGYKWSVYADRIFYVKYKDAYAAIENSKNSVTDSNNITYKWNNQNEGIYCEDILYTLKDAEACEEAKRLVMKTDKKIQGFSNGEKEGYYNTEYYTFTTMNKKDKCDWIEIKDRRIVDEENLPEIIQEQVITPLKEQLDPYFENVQIYYKTMTPRSFELIVYVGDEFSNYTLETTEEARQFYDKYKGAFDVIHNFPHEFQDAQSETCYWDNWDVGIYSDYDLYKIEASSYTSCDYLEKGGHYDILYTFSGSETIKGNACSSMSEDYDAFNACDEAYKDVYETDDYDEERAHVDSDYQKCWEKYYCQRYKGYSYC